VGDWALEKVRVLDAVDGVILEKGKMDGRLLKERVRDEDVEVSEGTGLRCTCERRMCESILKT
jgi:hypothetical protein